MDAESALLLIRHHGPLALVVLMALNRLGLIPGGMLILVTIGTFAGQGELPVVAALAAAYAGCMLGDSALYGAGRYGLGWVRRHQEGRQTWGRAYGIVGRWGAQAVFLTRWLFLPLTIAVSLICGVSRYRYRPFLASGAAGNLIFVLVFVGIGYRFGAGWRQVIAWAGAALDRALDGGPLTFALLALAPLAALIYRAAAHRRRLAADLLAAEIPVEQLG
jgi:membrane protein DedA with SNARE-associated domain